jgi:hypothetical protein
MEAAFDMANQIQNMYRFSTGCPEDLDPDAFAIAQEFLQSVHDPSFSENFDDATSLLRDFGIPLLQELVDRSSPEADQVNPVPILPWVADRHSRLEETVGVSSPTAPPAKRSRGAAASTSQTLSSSLAAPASAASVSSVSAGSGRVTRSISRGSHSSRGSFRPAASSSQAGPSQEDRKRKRSGK